MDNAGIVARRTARAVDKAIVFSMRNLPLLEQGTTYDPLATAENLWLLVKVYASGGENALHSHGGEDHSFIVLQGKATFTFGDGRTQLVGVHEGVMIPKDALQIRGGRGGGELCFFAYRRRRADRERPR